jgi:hypothetical protein
VRGRQAEAKLRFLGRLLAMPESRVVRRLLRVRAMDLERGLGCGKGWCARIAVLLDHYGLTAVCGSVAVTEWNGLVRKAVWDKEEEEWRAAMAGKPSLELYQRVKVELELETLADGGVEERRSCGLLVKLRGAGSDLEVEAGKRWGLERQNRACTVCGSGAVGDVEHFLLDCAPLAVPRAGLWALLEQQLADCIGGPAVWRVVAALQWDAQLDVMLGKRDLAWPGDVVALLDRGLRRGIWDMWRCRKRLLDVVSLLP